MISAKGGPDEPQWHSSGQFEGQEAYSEWGFDTERYNAGREAIASSEFESMAQAREAARGDVFEHLGFEGEYSSEALRGLDAEQRGLFNETYANYLSEEGVAELGSFANVSGLSGEAGFALEMEAQEFARAQELGFGGGIRANLEQGASEFGRFVDNRIIGNAASEGTGLFAEGKLLSSVGANPETLGMATAGGLAGGLAGLAVGGVLLYNAMKHKNEVNKVM